MVPSWIPDLTTRFDQARPAPPPPPQYLFHPAQGAAPRAPRPEARRAGSPAEAGRRARRPGRPPARGAPAAGIRGPTSPRHTHPHACAPAPRVLGSPKLPPRPPRGSRCSPAALRSASNAAPREGSEPPARLLGQPGVRARRWGGCSSRRPAGGPPSATRRPPGCGRGRGGRAAAGAGARAPPGQRAAGSGSHGPGRPRSRSFVSACAPRHGLGAESRAGRAAGGGEPGS